MSTRYRIAAMLVPLVIALAIAAADTPKTGTIKGRLTDKETGEPVIGASVMVVGTKFGSMTDPDGKYTVTRLEPGTYVIRISAVDYNTVDIKDVVVKSDLITEVNQKLTKKVTQLDIKIECGAPADPIQKYETSNQVSITSGSIQRRPGRTAYPPADIRGGRVASDSYYDAPRAGSPVPLSHGGSTTVNGEAFNAMFFKSYGTNPFVDTEDDFQSTFAVDVDDASFVMTRSYLERNALPPAEAVRAEEFINHFKYDYPSPKGKPFSVELEGAPSYFGTTNTRMLRIGIQGLNIPPEHRKPANLVFVIDISGSMEWGNRLGLVKDALLMLLDELTPEDQVGIVVYGSIGRAVLSPTSIAFRERIAKVIESLRSDGATNAEEGIRLGYQMADRMFDPRKLNRIILCSDGVANVGNTGPDAILEQIRGYAKKGITLTTVGFGMGNMNDILMEQLGDKGNGHYAYVDDIDEARRVFVDNLTGTLQVIARDVKIQVEFDFEIVRSYRLIGFENRDVADQDFRNDTVDGGEIGSGHRVTALYELKLHGDLDYRPLGQVYVRYKDADLRRVHEIVVPIEPEQFVGSFEDASVDFRLAATAAQFAELLRTSYWAKDESLDDCLAVARSLFRKTRDGEIHELVALIERSILLKDQLARK